MVLNCLPDGEKIDHSLGLVAMSMSCSPTSVFWPSAKCVYVSVLKETREGSGERERELSFDISLYILDTPFLCMIFVLQIFSNNIHFVFLYELLKF